MTLIFVHIRVLSSSVGKQTSVNTESRDNSHVWTVAVAMLSYIQIGDWSIKFLFQWFLLSQLIVVYLI